MPNIKISKEFAKIIDIIGTNVEIRDYLIKSDLGIRWFCKESLLFNSFASHNLRVIVKRFLQLAPTFIPADDDCFTGYVLFPDFLFLYEYNMER